ncbi:hypothetical protein D3822_32760, partial [Escherichia coli]
MTLNSKECVQVSNNEKIAIVGAGPTGIYTLFSLLQQQTPLSISIFEQADEAGVGMPYSDEENSKMM